jgi:hypothetical protein
MGRAGYRYSVYVLGITHLTTALHELRGDRLTRTRDYVSIDFDERVTMRIEVRGHRDCATKLPGLAIHDARLDVGDARRGDVVEHHRWFLLLLLLPLVIEERLPPMEPPLPLVHVPGHDEVVLSSSQANVPQLLSFLSCPGQNVIDDMMHCVCV